MTIQEAIEKQIPKTPEVKTTAIGDGTIYGYEMTTDYLCPSCHDVVGNDRFCGNCGQALDWSDEE